MHKFQQQRAARAHGRRPPSATSDAVRVIGPYNLTKKVGSGSYANVWIGHHAGTNQEVALKIVDRKMLQDGEEKMIRKEMRALKALSHPHLIAASGYTETADKLCIATDYLSGGELYTRLTKGRLPEFEAQRVFRQMVEAVAYMHSNGVAHRDIKPENIMFDASNDAKLIDLGFVTSFEDDSDRIVERCSSLWYASPEVLTDRAYHPKTVDVWSLGVLLYCMLVGRRPFDQQGESAVTEAVCAARFKIPEHVSREAADLVRMILVPEQTSRMSTDAILDHPWMLTTLPATGSPAPIPVTSGKAAAPQQRPRHIQPPKTHHHQHLQHHHQHQHQHRHSHHHQQPQPRNHHHHHHHRPHSKTHPLAAGAMHAHNGQRHQARAVLGESTQLNRHGRW